LRTLPSTMKGAAASFPSGSSAAISALGAAGEKLRRSNLMFCMTPTRDSGNRDLKRLASSSETASTLAGENERQKPGRRW